MNLSFTPVRMDTELSIKVIGDTLILNGEAYDFSPLPNGAVLPQAAVDCPWLASDVTRQDGEVALTLILPHGAGAPHETLFPASIRVKQDGEVALPPFAAKEVLHVED